MDYLGEINRSLYESLTEVGANTSICWKGKEKNKKWHATVFDGG
jgi:hypothetical protein